MEFLYILSIPVLLHLLANVNIHMNEYAHREHLFFELQIYFHSRNSTDIFDGDNHRLNLESFREIEVFQTFLP